MLTNSPNSTDALIGTPENPVPDGAIVGVLEAPDGASIRYARWETSVRPSKGTVLLLHGRSEYVEKYFETVEDLRMRGFGVLTFDWRGQGGSSRLLRDAQKGHIEHFNQYLTDLETVLTDVVLPDCKAPFYVVGHSTGGLIALIAAPALKNRVRRMMLISPLLELNNLPVKQALLQRALGFLTFMGLGRSYLMGHRTTLEKRKFEGNKLTSDPNRYQRNKDILLKDEALAISSPTIAWLFAACRAMARVNVAGYSNAIAIPTLLVAAGSDAVVSPAATEAFGRKMRSGSFLTISGAKHELLQERDIYREQVLAAFDAFIPGEGPDSKP